MTNPRPSSAPTERHPVSLTFDALGDDYFTDPARHFEKVRGDTPVFWYPYLRSWVLTRREDVELVLSDWRRFRSGVKGESITVPEAFQDVIPRDLFANILVGSDPPRHTSNRAVAQRGFVKPRMDALAPVIEARAHRIIDGIEHLGAANLMEAYCLELTTQTFMALVDLPPEDEPMMRQARDDLFMILGSALEPMQEPTLTEVWSRYTRAQLHLREIVRERAGSGGTDLISEMASVVDKEGRPVMPPEQVALHIGEFAGAATDTTAQAMANAVLFLSRNPEVLEAAVADPGLWPAVFDETVRRRPSGTGTRWATEDVEIGGAHIRAGDAVWLGLASANTDPDYYERPFEFELGREFGDHLAFTKGRHTCLGQPLARVQGAMGLKVLFERLPSLRPAPDVPLDFMPLALLPVRRTLPVVWTPPTEAETAERAARAAAQATETHPDDGHVHPPTFEVTVTRRRQASDGVITLDLGDPQGAWLPAWEPGAHIDVTLPDGTARQYSLCSDPENASTYRIGVLREPNGKGGSVYLHDEVREGSRLQISSPRNNFPAVDSPRYLFIAGGIGITPILPMIRLAESRGAEWTLLYGGRTRLSMALLDELEGYGERVVLRPQDEFGLLDLAGYLGEIAPDTVVYACGPEPLLGAVEAAMEHWPEGSLHVERFAPKPIEVDGPDEAFEVEFAESGVTLTVTAEQSILDAAEKAGINVFSSCQEGTCGTCETPLLEGRADHRDSLLTESEQDAQDTMMICVSRAERGCPRLVLGL